MRIGCLRTVIEGHPEGANIPFMPDAPQELAPGLYTDLRKYPIQILCP